MSGGYQEQAIDTFVAAVKNEKKKVQAFMMAHRRYVLAEDPQSSKSQNVIKFYDGLLSQLSNGSSADIIQHVPEIKKSLDNMTLLDTLHEKKHPEDDSGVSAWSALDAVIAKSNGVLKQAFNALLEVLAAVLKACGATEAAKQVESSKYKAPEAAAARVATQEAAGYLQGFFTKPVQPTVSKVDTPESSAAVTR